MAEEDLFDFTKQEQSMPIEITEQFKKIENIDPFEFKDGIDTDSHAYVYQNAFNQFRYENEHTINMNVSMMQKQSPLNE